jgi:hypothetical protein
MSDEETTEVPVEVLMGWSPDLSKFPENWVTVDGDNRMRAESDDLLDWLTKSGYPAMDIDRGESGRRFVVWLECRIGAHPVGTPHWGESKEPMRDALVAASRWVHKQGQS